MNALIIATIACLAAVNAAPSGLGLGAVVAGPAGIVTSHGAVGAVGLGHGALLVPPVATTVVSGPALGLGVVGLGHGGVVVKGPPTAPAVIAGPAGKIVADGLWGPTHAWGHGVWGHGW